MSSFFPVFFFGTTSGILFSGILDVPSIGLRALEAGVRALVPVGVTVVVVEGEPTPHRGTALSKGKYSRRHKCTKPPS